MIETFNNSIIQFLNSLIINGYIKNIVFLFADLPILFLPIFLVVAWLCIKFKWNNSPYMKENLILITMSCILAIIINYIIKMFVEVDRPETALNSANFILEHIPDASFPSDHAWVALAFLTWLFMAWYNKIFKIFGFFAILMLLSRIAWWVHWPTDIIAWSIVWVFSANFMFKIRENIFIKKISIFIIKLAWVLKL